MLAELRLSNHLTLSGFVVAVLLSASSAFAGPSDECAAAAAYVYGKQDYAEAFRLCGPLAEQGDAKAQSALGFMITNGEGVKVDYALSAKWYRKAAEQGYAPAQSTLGFMYDNGKGVLQDYAEAEKWYRKSAEQGDAFGQAYLGFMYEWGHGVPQDYALAYMWLNLAAAHSSADFDVTKFYAERRDDVAKKMTSAQIAEAQRLAREWKPTK